MIYILLWLLGLPLGVMTPPRTPRPTVVRCGGR